MLRLRNVHKSFGSLRVLSGVDLEVEEGEIHGLIGPNGAGKTTLFNVITGVLHADKGAIEFGGRDVTRLRTAERCHRGLARTFQIPQLFGSLTALGNAEVAALFGRGKRPPQAEARLLAADALELAGIAELADVRAAVLTTGQRKMLELARAIATGARLLLLDEVMAGLNPSELQHACESVAALSRQGYTILLVEHVMQALMSISRRVSVLFEGTIMLTDVPENVVRDPRVTEAYLGRSHHAA